MFYAPSFVVYSDNNPLTYVMTSARLDATKMRWVSEFAEYNFTLKYRPGKENGDADGLSRMPVPIESLMDDCTEEASRDIFGSVLNGIQARTCRIAATSPSEDIDVNVINTNTQSLDKKEIASAQREDPALKEVIHQLQNLSKRQPSVNIPQLAAPARQIKKLKLLDGVLYRVTTCFDGSMPQQLILPDKYSDSRLYMMNFMLAWDILV